MSWRDDALVSCLVPGGRILIETANTPDDAGTGDGAVRVVEPGGMYAHDAYVFWEFSSGGLHHMVSHTRGCTFEMHSNPVVAGLPRIIGVVNAPATISQP